MVKELTETMVKHYEERSTCKKRMYGDFVDSPTLKEKYANRPEQLAEILKNEDGSAFRHPVRKCMMYHDMQFAKERIDETVILEERKRQMETEQNLRAAKRQMALGNPKKDVGLGGVVVKPFPKSFAKKLTGFIAKTEEKQLELDALLVQCEAKEMADFVLPIRIKKAKEMRGLLDETMNTLQGMAASGVGTKEEVP